MNRLLKVRDNSMEPLSVPTIEIESPDLSIACLQNPFHTDFHTFQRFLDPVGNF